VSGRLDPERIIETLGLTPLLPEGGHIRQTHLDERSCAIYYLMEAPDFSGLHRLEHLEIWAYHAGAPVAMLLIDEAGIISEPVLGLDLEAGHRPQVIVPPRCWQAAEPLGLWSLVSTFMTPPYSDDTVSFARRTDFAGVYPAHEARIARLCRF
jgi:uncharacterized protein